MNADSDALLDVFVLAPVGLVEVDETGRVEVANAAARRMLAPFIATGTLDDVFAALRNVAPDLSARVRAFDGPRGLIVESMELLAADAPRGVYLSLVKVAAGRIVVVTTHADGVAAARDTIANLQQRLRAVEGAIRDYALFTVTVDGLIDSWNESAERLHQWSSDDVIGKPLSMLVPPDATADAHVRDAFDLASRNGWSEDEGMRARRDGTTFWANTVISALRGHGDAITGFSVITRDVSERRKLDEVSRDHASSTTDYLTGASNRRAFFEVAGAEVSRGRRYGQPLSMLLVDPDRVRELTEQHGDAFADEWLRAIALVCRQESRTTDVVGRVGGEAFAVLLPSTELPGGLVLAERIRERMQRHVFQGAYQGVRSTLCVGVAELTDDVTTVDALLTAAGKAVERAKSSGMNLVVGFDA